MTWKAPDDEVVSWTPPAEDAVIEDVGATEAAARGALRNIPFGQQVAAGIAPINPFSEKKTYGEELKHLTEQAEAAKKARPGAYGAGAVAGTVAPLLIPGVAPAMAASMPAAIASNAALGAAQSLSDANLGDLSKENIQEAAIGAGIGGVLGGAGKALMPAARAIPKAIPTPQAAPVAEQVAREGIEAAAAPIQQAKGVAGLAVPNRAVAPDFSPSAERIYASNIAQAWGGTPRQLMKAFGKRDYVKSLNEVGAWMEKAGPEGTSLHGMLDRPGELVSKVAEINKNAGKTIGGIIEDMGPVTNINRPQFRNELREFAQATADPDTEARIVKLIKSSDHLSKKGISDFEMLQQIKKMAGKQIAKDPEMSEVYGFLSDKMTSLVDEYGTAVKSPELRALYGQAKTDYHQSSRILPILRYAEAKDVTGGPGGHHTMRGLLASIYNMAMETVGIPDPKQIARNLYYKAAPVSKSLVGAGEKARAALPNARPGAALSPAAQMELVNYLQSQYNKKTTP